MTLPNFLVIGAMKSGTSSLYEYLRAHPQVFMAATKELQFFGRDDWEDRLDWYRAQFAEAGGSLAVGEASTNYTKYPEIPDAAPQIVKVLPDVKLVYLIRHPIERARSHYLHSVLRGKEHRPIERALREDPRYLDFGRYAMQLERYLDHLPRERLLVLRTEDLKEDRLAVVQAVYRFLDVDPRFVPPAVEAEFYRTEERRERRPLLQRVRRMPGYRAAIGLFPLEARRRLWGKAEGLTTWQIDPEQGSISADLRRELAGRLVDDVRRLRELLGSDFDGWGIV